MAAVFFFFFTEINVFLLVSLVKLVFSYSEKLFNLVVKDIEAMDTSILRGEKTSDASGKKVSANVPLIQQFSYRLESTEALYFQVKAVGFCYSTFL